MMHRIDTDLDTDFGWLTTPVLNPRTRLAMVADAKAGRLVAQGYEAARPATRRFDMTV
jgi:hypothetical protein